MTQTAERPVLTRDERAALRLEQYRRRRVIGWVTLALVVVLAVAGGYVTFFTSVLGLKSVAVTSTTGALDTDLDASIRSVVGPADGTPLIRIDLDALEQQVETIPGVSDASISRHWPGTLRVTVTPRVPRAVVAANSALYLMDSTGTPYQTVSMQPSDLVNLRLATPGPGDPATMAGLSVVQALPLDRLPQVSSVTARSPYDITVELADGRSINWGDTTDNERKAQILPAILARPGTQFDITDPELVTVR